MTTIRVLSAEGEETVWTRAAAAQQAASSSTGSMMVQPTTIAPLTRAPQRWQVLASQRKRFVRSPRFPCSATPRP